MNVLNILLNLQLQFELSPIHQKFQTLLNLVKISIVCNLHEISTTNLWTKLTTNYEQNIFDAFKVFAEIDNALFQEKVQSIVVTSVF